MKCQSLRCRMLTLAALISICGCSSAPSYPPSDHYDGNKFFNPGNEADNGFWDALKMLVTRDFEEWPAHVEDARDLNLDSPLRPDEVAVTFVNHATMLIQTSAFNCLTDPVWSERVSPFTWVGPKRHREPGVPFERLPRIDFVVISHNHYDHMDLATLVKLNNAFHPRFFVPLGNKAFLEANQISNVTELDWWQSFDLNAGVKVSLTPAKHFSGRALFDKNKTLWGSYFITFNGHGIYFGGDTAYSPHFKVIREHFGRPDLAFLPIGAYEPRWFMKRVHVDPSEAVQAHLDLGSRRSIGIHFGTFQLTNEKIDQPTKDLGSALRLQSLDADTFVTLTEGKTEIFELKAK